MLRHLPWSFLVVVFAPFTVLAQQVPPEPTAPAPPAKYDVIVRYQIDAFRNERLVQFDEMLRFFAKLGFDKAPGPEDEAENRKYTRMLGAIPSGNARKLLVQRHVKALLLVPAGTKLPSGEAPVRVQLELAGGPVQDAGRFLYPTERVRKLESEGGEALQRQRRLAEQVRSVLVKLGFREAVGYDDRAHTRLVGTIPYNKLTDLLEDLRQQPGAAELPAPFASRWPLLVTEVMPSDMPLTKDRPAVPAPPKGQENLAPELRHLLASGGADTPQRLEVILWTTPAERDETWRTALTEAAPGLAVEGRVGPLVSVLAKPAQAPALGALPIVSAVRLPRSAQPRLLTVAGSGKSVEAALKASGLARLHTLGRRGRGVRVAILDGDFRGWQAELGKRLPAGTRLIDLTAERNRDLRPDPFPGDPGSVGHGTHVALVAARAAPEAEFVLVRIDPAAPYQLLAVARAINGEAVRSLNLEQRDAELEQDRFALQVRREKLTEEREIVFGIFGDDPVWIKRREEYRKNQAKLDQDERDLQERLRRYLNLLQDLRGLRTVRVVASALAWREGHPVDGGGPLGRYFDDHPFRAAFWFQAAGDTRGQAWAAPFRDRDGDGVMEFLPPGAALPSGLWNSTLAFLAWGPAGGKTAPELPAKVRLRVSVQWREPHDPDFLRRGEDAYREPLATLRLLVLRQLDPAGAKQPADDFEVVAQPVGLPQRLDNLPHAATYEQTVEFTVNTPGRYALRLEGRVPAGIRPKGTPTLPALEQTWELRPRIFVETLDGAGRAVLEHFATGEGSIGTPGDARGALTVGEAVAGGEPASTSARGPVFGVELLTKPTVLAPAIAVADGPAGGTSRAVGFAAGLAASALSAGASRLLQDLRVGEGQLLRVPEGWPSVGR